MIVGDEIGVAVVPYGDLKEVYEKAKQQASREEATREEILKGASGEARVRKVGSI